MDDDKPRPCDVMTGSSLSSLTTSERLQASATAAFFVMHVHSLKAPLRRLIVEEVRRFLNDE